MLKNYFKLAFRNLSKNKIYSSINLLGLAVGMACCLVIVIYVLDELSYDKFHGNVKNIYRLLHHYDSSDKKEDQTPPSPEEYEVWGNAPVGPVLVNSLPEIKRAVRFTSPTSYLIQGEERRFQENVVFIDSTVFEIFDFKLVQGNPSKALVGPQSVVLSEEMAIKYFGTKDAIGKTLLANNRTSFIVTGVMEDIPKNSHLDFDILISMSYLRQQRPDIFEQLGYIDFYTYLLLDDNVNLSALEKKIPSILRQRFSDQGYSVSLEPMSDAYLHSKAMRQPGETGSLANIYIFSIVAAFILFIACFNYVNLATARSLDRAKEVGIRKVVGASKKSLILQYMMESITLCLLAGILALLLAAVSFPLVQELTGKLFSARRLLSWDLIFAVIVSASIVGILAGIYPSLVLTSFKPVLVLKGVFRNSPLGITARKSLIVLQFALSIALLASTAIVYSQLNHLKNRDLGFRQEQMLIIDFGGDRQVSQKIETIKRTFLEHPDVTSATSSRAVPGDFVPNAWTELRSAEGDIKGDAPFLYEVDFEFIDNYNIKIIAGRPFSRDFPSDTARAVVLNRAATELYGYTNPEDAVGQPFTQWGREGAVVGVVENFHFQSLHHEVEPLALRLAPEGALSKLSLTIESDQMSQTMGDLEKTWNRLAPQRPFLYRFLDESFNEQYKKDVRFGKIFVVFSGFAIFIACLGLLGLVAYTAKQRKKEIGIRKVLGASIAGIIVLLSKDLMKLVLIASIIAIPVSWYFMQEWLNDFPYRLEISLWYFVGAGSVAAAVAFLTIALQSLKAARSNPVENIRTE